MSSTDRFSADTRLAIRAWMTANGPDNNELMKFVVEEIGKVTEGKFQPLIDYVKAILTTPDGDHKKVDAAVL